MSYLLDTCAISEFNKRAPNQGLVDWYNSFDVTDLYLSSVTIGEISLGIEKMAAGSRRIQLADWLEVITGIWFRGRILPFDHMVAQSWARMRAGALRTISPFDGLIAATALHHGLTVVTRNVADFKPTGVQWINPWDI